MSRLLWLCQRCVSPDNPCVFILEKKTSGEGTAPITGCTYTVSAANWSRCEMEEALAVLAGNVNAFVGTGCVAKCVTLRACDHEPENCSFNSDLKCGWEKHTLEEALEQLESK